MRVDAVALLVAMGGLATALPSSVSEAPSASITPRAKLILRPLFLIPPFVRKTITLPNGNTTTKIFPWTEPTVHRSKWLTILPRDDVAAATPTADKSLPVITPTSYSVKYTYRKTVMMQDHTRAVEPAATLEGPQAEAVQMGFTIDAAAGHKSAAGLAIVAAALAGVVLL